MKRTPFVRKPHKPMKRGRKVDRWSVVRSELKIEFGRRGIVRCELCLSTFALGFAHRVKRRFITDDDEMRKVALLCQQCHHFVEYGDKDNAGTHERMASIIDGIIENRDGA